jgi:hypothetical protein
MLVISHSGSGRIEAAKRNGRTGQVWNVVAQRRMSAAWSRAYYEPARRVFPAVKASNFDHYRTQPGFCTDGTCFTNGTISHGR